MATGTKTILRLTLWALSCAFVSPLGFAQTLEITEFSAEGDRITLAWTPPIDGIVIERIDLESQQVTPLFAHAKSGTFISRAAFTDTHQPAYFRLRWQDGSLAVYVPSADTPIELLAYRPPDASNAPARAWNLPPVFADASGQRLYFPERQPLPPELSVAQFRNLKRLHLWGRQIRDIAFLSEMTRLEDVVLDDNFIEVLPPLEAHTNLTALSIGRNRIADLAPLEKLANLQHLHVSDNPLHDLAPLAKCAQLRALGCSRTGIRDLSGIRHLDRLEMLYVDANPLDNLDPIRGLTNVLHFTANSCRIKDLSPMAGMRDLIFIELDDNAITDLSPLACLNCSYLSVTSNRIHDVAPLLEIAKRGGFQPRRGNPHGIDLTGNPLSRESIEVVIPELRNQYGIKIVY